MRRVAGFTIGFALTGCGLFLSEPPIDRSDPRFAQCAGIGAEVEAAFPMIASEYKRHFPRMGLSPELEEGNQEAFAVVFAEGVDNPRFPGSASGTGRWVCIYVGNPPDGYANHYGDVDIGGMPP